MRTTPASSADLKPLRDARLLEAWERASAVGDSGRAAALLSVAGPELSREQWEDVGLPEVNLQLARLRQISFGSDLTAHLPCSKCGTRLEFNLDLTQIIQRLETLSEETAGSWSDGRGRFSMRTITGRDLAAVQTCSDTETARRSLLERCTEVNGLPASDESTSAALRASESIALETFARLHQAAEITCRVACVNCGHADETDLDLARFIWAEVRHRAARLLRDVHELASTYGWPEEEILRLPAQRRDKYLEMIRS
jgi:hypothetical protein